MFSEHWCHAHQFRKLKCPPRVFQAVDQLMAIDRTIRLLSALSGASSNRVLNLCALAVGQANNPGHSEKPLFRSKALNSAIIVKHNIRSNEKDYFSEKRTLATKVLLPFNTSDLLMGGASFFVNEKNFEQTVQSVGNYTDQSLLQGDIERLRLLDSLPSFDPFLLREHLARNGCKPDACYFVLSNSDQLRMAEYSAGEVRKLTVLATGGSGSGRDASTEKMVKALLSNDVSELLEPFRAVLQLNQSQFSEGVFSWRGFLYYKWGLQNIWPQLIDVLRGIRSVVPIGKSTSDEKAFFEQIKRTIIKGSKSSNDDVQKIIAIYDSAYSELINNKNPKEFRDFLLSAPALFCEIGEKMGAMSHIASFWRYRFPNKSSLKIDTEELTLIFQEFAQSLGTADANG